jgi:hypothetical protein
MKKIILAVILFMSGTAYSQTTAPTPINQGSYDSKSLVDTNSTSISVSTVNTNSSSNSTSTATNNTNITSTSTSTNNNNNVNSGTMTYNNNNVNSGTVTYNNNNVNSGTMNNISTSTSTNTNNNVNSGTMTYNNNNTSTSANTNNNVNTGDMTNRNINTGDMTNRNINTSTASNTNVNQNIQSGTLTNNNINESNITQRVIQPPPTTIAPTMMSGGNQDLCSTGTSGAVQTQIFGVSSGGTVRDLNCERLKLSKTLFDMGMKVAAVATMCQDRRVYDAMLAAGTPCPYEGKIGQEAKALWEANPNKVPKLEEANNDETYKKIGIGSLLGIAVYKLFGF